MIKNIGWTLGNDCPCKCKHCYSFTVRKKGQNLTKEIVNKVIEQIEKLNVETVNLGGNEPIFTNGLDVIKSMLPYINQYNHSILNLYLQKSKCWKIINTYLKNVILLEYMKWLSEQ